MHRKILTQLRCPLSFSQLDLQVLRAMEENPEHISEGILIAETGPVYPILEGVPRLLPDAMLEHEDFLRSHLVDYDLRLVRVKKTFLNAIETAERKNKKTRKSFSLEWEGHDYQSGKTWNLDAGSQVNQFFRETAENPQRLQGKTILDAGCGNGHLAMQIANFGIRVFAIDFSTSIVRASRINSNENCHFIQADVEMPPFCEAAFDLIHSSGVLIHTRNTRNSFLGLLPFVRKNGKISIWVYRKRKEFLHLIFNQVRNFTSQMHPVIQIPFLRVFIYLPALILKRLKGNQQPTADLWVEILDWFTPEFRWEHSEEDVKSWFREAGLEDVEISEHNHWGFNAIGIKA